ncbi:MAG: 50S ribosomal protein L2 [Nanoarchaeota archaeon]|nr:50S ribosomal protein L2 [Nanoarchaeota archaeon]
MGKRIIQQARGKGSPTYRAPSFNYKGEAKYVSLTNEVVEGKVIDLVHCRGHSSPLAQVEYDNGDTCLLIAAEHIKVGDTVSVGGDDAKKGDVLSLGDIPEGTLIFNIEGSPGDGGKFVRSSGTFARVLSQMKDSVLVQLPSKKKKTFYHKCRASIGTIAGGGRTDKPILKAGKKFYAMKAKNKLWPKVSGGAMNAVDHPFGNGRSSRKSNARPAPKNAPPGRKVGMLSPRHTGRNK